MRAAALALVWSLTGCVGPLVETIKVDPERAAALLGSVHIVDAAALAGKHADTIAPLKATSCKNKMWDPDPTEQDAINQLKLMAARANANALTNLYCEAPRGVNLATNCWSAIVCHASALRILSE